MAGLRLGTFLAALVLCLCREHAEAGGFSLDGRHLGERVDTVLNDSRYECGGVSACLLYTVCKLKLPGSESFAGVPLTGLSLYFAGERLTAIKAQFPPERFDQVLGDRIQELGPGQSILGRIRRDPAASSGSVVYVWREGSQVLRLERASRDPTPASLIITQENFLSELLGQ